MEEEGEEEEEGGGLDLISPATPRELFDSQGVLAWSDPVEPRPVTRPAPTAARGRPDSARHTGGYSQLPSVGSGDRGGAHQPPFSSAFFSEARVVEAGSPTATILPHDHIRRREESARRAQSVVITSALCVQAPH